MKKPIPAPIACFSDVGIESIIFFLIPVIDISKNMIPDINTSDKPSCQVYP